MFPALAGPAGSPLPTDDAAGTIPWRLVARTGPGRSPPGAPGQGILAGRRRHGTLHVRLHPDPPAPSGALGHADPGGGAVAGLPVGEHPAWRPQAGAAAGMGRAERRPAAGGHPAVLGRRRTLAAPVHGPAPARGLGAPAGQPGVPADLRPARGAGDGAVAVPAAVPA